MVSDGVSSIESNYKMLATVFLFLQAIMAGMASLLVISIFSCESTVSEEWHRRQRFRSWDACTIQVAMWIPQPAYRSPPPFIAVGVVAQHCLNM